MWTPEPGTPFVGGSRLFQEALKKHYAISRHSSFTRLLFLCLSPPPNNGELGAAISLSQAHTSDGDSSEHSPRSASTLSASGGGDGSTKSKTNPCNKIITLDNRQHHQTPSSSDNTARKPKGRPQGSKNKLKPPFVITRDSDSTGKPVILEISVGSDVIDTIINFARTNNDGVSIISATGSVSNVMLSPPVSHAQNSLFMNPFGLLSSSGSFIASTTLSSSNKTTQSCTNAPYYIV